MKLLTLLLVLLLPSPGWALEFQTAEPNYDMMGPIQPGKTMFNQRNMPYSKWLTTAAGVAFPFNPAPAVYGLAHGKTKNYPVQNLDPSAYPPKAGEFAELLNDRNQNGRPLPKMKDSPEKDWQRIFNGTQVVEFKMDTVIPRALDQIDLSPNHIVQLAEKIDVDHYEYLIPGTFVEQALEAGDPELGKIKPNVNYLLTVVDFSKYDCDVMTSTIKDYFAHSPTSEPLHNDSVYMISDVAVNRPDDLTRSRKYFGRQPDVIVVQRVVYADHVLHGGETIFAFFAEGAKTRVAMISELGMKSSFFNGRLGSLISEYVLNGFTGILGKVAIGASEAKDAFSNFLAGVEDDVQKRNTCNRGLGLGLIRYSQSLFKQFIARLDQGALDYSER